MCGGVGDDSADESMRQLHWDGWTSLPNGMPDWEICHFVEHLYRRHNKKILRLLEKWREDWMESDEGGDAPGTSRPGALVARRISESLDGTGVFLYAAHPSQSDDTEDEWDYSGPRWYVTCVEAAMKHFKHRGVAPPPPAELQSLLWPQLEDRRKPWLTELGWTIVPENSDPQVMHADICDSEAPHPRKPGLGRYQHFAWKLNKSERCTTNIVPGAFTEGCCNWSHYDNWTAVKAPALIFDSEMLHRGGVTGAVGWSSSLTLQVCSGTGWEALHDRSSRGMMWYTQQLGWEEGAAVDALIETEWTPAIVQYRDEEGIYEVRVDLSTENDKYVTGLSDSDLRYRQARVDAFVSDSSTGLQVGAEVEGFFEDEWYPAKITRQNMDGTYRVVWQVDSKDEAPSCFTDGISAALLRRKKENADAGGAASAPAKKRKVSHEQDSSSLAEAPSYGDAEDCASDETTASSS